MKNYFKTICVLLGCVLAFTMSVSAAPSTEYADKLKELGLFCGTDQGYELDKPLTREQSATMLVRLLGAEAAVKTQNYKEAFADVPTEKWSFPYVMYCYEQKITKGTGADTFSPENNITAQEFITLVLRLLGYKDAAPETAYETAVNVSLINSQTVAKLKNAQQFLREDMVYISYRSLQTKTADGKVLARVLADQGVLTKQQADELDIYSGGSFDDVLDGLLG